jgi:hypothetical protein
MKTVGSIIFTIDLLKTLYKGFTNVTQEKDMDFDELEMNAENQHSAEWHPYIGIGMMIIGGAFLILGRKKLLTA